MQTAVAPGQLLRPVGQTLTAAGATVIRGTIADLLLLRDSASRCDETNSLAFGSNGTGPEALAQAIAEETAALKALGEALIDTGKPIVAIGGTPQTPGRPATEADPSSATGPVGGRARSVNALLELASLGVRPSTVRMPRTVDNEGKGGFAGVLVDTARRIGFVGYPGRDATLAGPACPRRRRAVQGRTESGLRAWSSMATTRRVRVVSGSWSGLISVSTSPARVGLAHRRVSASCS